MPKVCMIWGPSGIITMKSMMMVNCVSASSHSRRRSRWGASVGMGAGGIGEKACCFSGWPATCGLVILESGNISYDTFSCVAFHPFVQDLRAIVVIMCHCRNIDGLDSPAAAGLPTGGHPDVRPHRPSPEVRHSGHRPRSPTQVCARFFDGMRWPQRLVAACETQFFGNAAPRACCALSWSLAGADSEDWLAVERRNSVFSPTASLFRGLAGEGRLAFLHCCAW